ncbi:MAG: tetratricopeptide repeat protein [Elusimicrobia bacterium]|nr:tetratricopeptide repeat protein [Elusimicrobiota bacterium]
MRNSRVFFLAAALAMPVCGAGRGANATDFKKAGEFYLASQFEQAIALYQNMLAVSPHSAALHYNLGNSHFKSGNLGLATASYLRAYALAPLDADIAYNLDFCLKRVGETLYPPGVPKPLFLAFHALSLNAVAAAFWILSCGLLLWLSLYPWTTAGLRPHPALQALLGRLIVIFLLLDAAFGSWWWLRSSQEKGLGVVAANGAEVRNGPGENFSVGFMVPEGRRVKVLETRADWMEIGVLKEGVKGWLLKDSVILVNY